MTGNWQNTFGGASVNPSNLSFEYIALDANTALVWALESSGQPTVAPAMEVVASAANLSLAMPDATQAATGVIGQIYNAGNTSFTVTDTNGAQIVVVGTGQNWIIWLIDNGTPSGAWLAFQLGATTSNAQASALAGAGLQAISTQLQSFIETTYLNTNTLLSTSYRASAVVWQAAASGTLQLDTISTVTAGWWVLINNLGTEDITISTTGTDTINGVATIPIPAGGSGAPYSVLIVASSEGFNTFAGTPSIIPISGGGTGADNADQALINLGGSTIGIEVFEAPNAAAILALLGIGPSAFTEVTVASNQTITESSINNAFVCTTALTLSLPDSTTVANSFLFAAYAQGGAVTITPVSTDAVNGGGDGTSFVMPLGTSAIWTTDADGNWWPFFFYIAGGPQWAVASGTPDAITVAFSPPNLKLTDGLLIGVRATAANTTTTPALNIDGLGAGTIVKNALAPLVPNDISGAGFEMLLRYNMAGKLWELLNPATPWLDNYSTTQGAVLFRGATYWQALPPGAQGQVLNSGYLPSGISPVYVNPAWASPNVPEMHGQLFLSTGNFTVPANATTATVFKFKVIGGGGGGGFASGGSGAGGGGGGAGGYGEVLVSGFQPGAVVTATVGAGGGGSYSNASNGATGSTSKVTLSGVDFITSAGGVGGTSSSSSPNAGGAAGAVSINTASAGLSLNGTMASSVASGGNQGGYVASSVALGGNGGSNPYGQGGGMTPSYGIAATAGQAGSGYGGGGAGGSDGGNGGNASNGAVIVEWVL